jgi:hypothetical protein
MDKSKSQNTGPMVTVKKADGTTVKMSLGELRAMKKGYNNKAKKQKSKKTIIPPTPKADDPMVRAKKQIAQIEELQKKVKSMENTKASTPQSNVPKTLAEGLELLIATRSKTQNSKPKLEQSDSTVSRSVKSSVWGADDHKSLLHDDFHMDDIHAENEARRVALSKVSPVVDAFVDQAVASVRQQKSENEKPPRMAAKKINWDSVKPVESLRNLNRVGSSPKSEVQSPVKQSMHDIRPPAPTNTETVGPVDELRQFSIGDYRKLAASPDASMSKIVQKLATLKEESFLLFMDGVAAWHQSPIYTSYQNVIADALFGKKTIDAQLQSTPQGEGLNKEEFNSIVAISKSLM